MQLIRPLQLTVWLPCPKVIPTNRDPHQPSLGSGGWVCEGCALPDRIGGVWAVVALPTSARSLPSGARATSTSLTALPRAAWSFGRLTLEALGCPFTLISYLWPPHCSHGGDPFPPAAWPQKCVWHRRKSPLASSYLQAHAPCGLSVSATVHLRDICMHTCDSPSRSFPHQPKCGNSWFRSQEGENPCLPSPVSGG